MGIEIMPTNRELLRQQQKLPDSLRQSCIVLEFGREVPRHMVGEFLRVHLTRNMLNGGAADFYQPEVFQPQRVKRKLCPMCREPMAAVALFRTKCRNPKCKHYAKEQVNGPIRGIVKVLVFPENVARTDPVTKAEWVKACVVVLDRQYRPEVLAAIKRTCVELGEPYDWRVR